MRSIGPLLLTTEPARPEEAQLMRRALIQMQAQDGKIEATAQKNIEMTSVDGQVIIKAPKEILLTAGGGYIRIGSSIEIHNPEALSMKAADYKMEGPASLRPPLPIMPRGDVQEPDAHSQRIDISQLVSSDEVFANVPYKVHFPDKRVFEGITDSDGRTMRIHDTKPIEAKIIFGDGEWGFNLDADHIDDENDNGV